MLLAIDSGNTNIVFAVYDRADALRGSWRASTEAKRTADEYAVWLTQLMALEGLTPDDIGGAIIANVVPASMYALKTVCSRYFDVTPLVIGEPGVDLGIEVRLPRETLKGTFKDLDERGALVLELAGGETRLISAGDVYFGE